MGYTHYLTVDRTMSEPQWLRYVGLMRRLYMVLLKKGLRLSSFDPSDDASPPYGTKLPVARKDVVYFHGSIPSESCEPFMLQRSDFGKREARIDLYCKTNRLPYTFAVKCALILLAECGGARNVSADDNDLDEWMDAARWLEAQEGFPDAYPNAKHILVMNFANNFSEDALLLRTAINWKNTVMLSILLSPDCDRRGVHKYRRMGLHILEVLRRRVLARRKERVRLWVPRLITLLSTAYDS